jgi:hypothetical protein
MNGVASDGPDGDEVEDPLLDAAPVWWLPLT